MTQHNVRNQGTLPFPKFYFSDGTGRDSYIQINSGGITVDKKNAEIGKSGKFMSFPRGNSAKRIIKPSTSNKTIHYHSDGSGRDNYVVCDDGGQYNNLSQHYATVFKKSLRAPSANSHSSQNIYNLNMTNQLKYAQSNMNFRLATPKGGRTTKPFEFYVNQAISAYQTQKHKSTYTRRQQINFNK